MVNTKEYRGVSGVYKIENRADGKVYIGSAVDIGKRWSVHLHLLRGGKHHSNHLQSAWNKYGQEVFGFFIIEFVEDKSTLITREQYWLDFYHSANDRLGYNICPTAGSQLGFTHSVETREKISAVQRGGKRGPLTDEHKACVAAAHRGVLLTKEHKSKLSAAHSKNWFIISPEGEQFEVHNLKQFCKDNNLDQGNMHKVAQGKCKYSKGWRCKYKDS